MTTMNAESVFAEHPGILGATLRKFACRSPLAVKQMTDAETALRLFLAGPGAPSPTPANKFPRNALIITTDVGSAFVIRASVGVHCKEHASKFHLAARLIIHVVDA